MFYRSAQEETLQPFPGMFRQINSKLLPHPTPYTLVVKNPPANAGDIRDMDSIPWVGKIPLEEGMATHFSILVWRTPWTEERGGL